VAEQQNVSIIIDALNRAKGAIDKTVKDLGGLNQAGNQAARGLNEADKAMKRAEQSARGLDTVLARTGKTLLAAFTIQKLQQITVGALEATDELAALAQGVGMAADSLRRMERVAGDVNIKSQQFRGSMRFLSDAMREAQETGSKAAQAFELLGVSTIDAATGGFRPVLDVTMDLSAALSQYADGVEKTIMMQEFFGRGSQRITALMNMGPEEIKRQMEAARGLTQQQIDTAEKWSTMAGQLNGLLQDIGLSVGQVLMPALSNLANAMDNATKMGDGWSKGLTTAGTALEKLTLIAKIGTVQMQNLLEVYRTIGNVAGAVASVRSQGVSGAAGGVMDALKGGAGRTVDRVKGLANEVGKALGFTKEQAKEEVKITKEQEKQGKKQMPILLDSKVKLRDVDALRAKAEADYQAALLDTQDLLQRGAISANDAFERDKAAAAALAVELGKVNQELARLASASPNNQDLSSKLAQGMVAQRQAGLSAGAPGVNDWSAQMRVTMQQMRDEFSITAQKIAQTFHGVVRGSIDSVSDGLTNVIIGTETWGEAMANVAKTIGTSVVNAIVRMFTEWVAKRALMGLANIAWSAKEGAADVAAKTPGALMSSISSFGVAAAVGTAALLAALAAFGAFKEGGYTGDGAANQAAGVVHKGEYVIPAPVVSRLGAGYFEEYRQGRIPQAGQYHGTPAPNRSGAFRDGGLAAVPTGGAQTNMNIAFLNSRNDMREFMAREGYRIFAEEAAKRSNTFKA
jgi:hypothetical protein